jgi:hypothetical protein
MQAYARPTGVLHFPTFRRVLPFGELDGESTVMKRSPSTPRVRRTSAGRVLALIALGLMCSGAILSLGDAFRLSVEDAFRLALAISFFAAFTLALLYDFPQTQAAPRRKNRVNT